MTVAVLRQQTAHWLFIDGAWCEARGNGSMAVLNPATGEQIAEVAAGIADVDATVTAAHEAFTDGRWSGLTPG